MWRARVPTADTGEPRASARSRATVNAHLEALRGAGDAERLFLSPRTVNSHVRRNIGKLGAANRREVVAMAARFGLA